jgi:hypothetical protein
MAKIFLLIVVGLAGDAEHGELFRKWGQTLAEASARLGVAQEQLIYLVDEPDEDNRLVTGGATRDEVTKALQSIAGQAGPDDLVFITLIGHGTYSGGTARFNLRGPDMTPADFDVLLTALPVKQLVFVNTASASGPFLEGLSRPGRTIITATRSGAEQYATLFGGAFVEALTSDVADADKNRRVSVLEAYNHARAEVERAYKREGLLQTEHAMLDDDGDKEGAQAISATTKDGRVAAILSLGSIDGTAAPSDPKLAALMEERRELERRVEQLRLLKESMEPARYTSQLEQLAVEIARKTREIRELEQ